jgi:hypothetical protein
MRRQLCGLAAAALAACAPALDWREVRPEGSGVTALLPCRPSQMERTLPLAGRPVKLLLAACSAGGQTWGIAVADMGDPALVGPALDALRRSAAANVGAAEGRPLPLTVPGATPAAQAGRVALEGRNPEGRAVLEQVAVFAHGTRVVQATVLGEKLPADGVDTFFTSLKVGP